MRLLSAFLAALIYVGGLSVAMAQSGLDQSVTNQSGSNDSATAIINNRPLTARILGGGDAEPGEYPSMVALVTPGFVPLDQRLFCGGTLVADRWIMTAAHCVHDIFNLPRRPDFIRVVAGIDDLVRDTPDREHRVRQIIIHPNYDGLRELPPNDIALLELETVVNAPVATLFAGETNDFTSTFGFIAGWGAIEYADPDNPVYPTMLQDALVPLITNELCNAPQSYGGLIADTHLCAGFADGMVDACAGDSGGPLFINANGVQVQAGITSFGNGCGLPLFYGIYTNVSHFIPWLGQYIDVPFQDPQLAAFRAIQANDRLFKGSLNSDGGLFGGGALAWPGLWLLLAVFCTRATCNCRVRSLLG
ncbi:MAG: serine protease [Granulosicoccus sp.]